MQARASTKQNIVPWPQEPTEAAFTSSTAPGAPLLGSRILLATLVASVVFFCVPFSMADPDIWWHLRNAQIQLGTHSFLQRDLFSFTAAGARWINHEWLAELPFYLAFRLGGTTGLYLLTLLTLITIFLGLLYLSYRVSRSIAAATIATILGVLLSTVSFGPRTLLFGWILLLVELIVLERSRSNPWVLWALPLVFTAWVNTHGSWLIGAVILLLYVCTSAVALRAGACTNTTLPRRDLLRLLKVSAASLAALFLNPYGWHLVLYPLDLAFRQNLNVSNVEEWKSLDFHSPRGRVLLVCLALLFLLQLVRSRTWTLYEILLACVGVYSAVTYSRFLFLAAILVMPVLATSLAPRSLPAPRKLPRPVASAIVFLLLCLAVGRVRTAHPDAIGTDARFPGKALPTLLALHPSGRVFNEFLWGGYLVWNVPDIPVFIDSRVDIFEYNGTFKDYLDIVHLQHPLELLDRYNIRYVVFESNSPLVYLLKTSPQWKLDYSDPTTAILERLDPSGATP